MRYDAAALGYQFNSEGLEFILAASDIKDDVREADIFITGSFNDWRMSADSAWKMKKNVSKGETYFSLQKTVSNIDVPGNSGFPEFRFFMISPQGISFISYVRQVQNLFSENRVILKNDDEAEFFESIKFMPLTGKALSDFDQNCPACRAELANLRCVPGSRSLFRGYHPYRRTRPDSDLEDARFNCVAKAFSLYGIKSVITLSGMEMPSDFAEETFPEYLTHLKQQDNLMWLTLSYELIYYHSDSAEFSNHLQKICRFLLSHPGPTYIHCRVGGDRTGVVCAVLAALCGASWEAVAVDFERTYLSGIGDWRSRNLLRYSIHKMIGFDPASSKDLAHVMQSYFIREKILSAAEIGRLITKLNMPPKKKETDYFNFDEKHICAKRSAKI